MKQFDLEQSIMTCWQVCDDLQTVTEFICDSSETAKLPPDITDKLSNITIGMKELYQLKFEKCFSDFEDVSKELWELRKQPVLQTHDVNTDFKNQRLETFCRRLLDPEAFGLAVSDEVRREAKDLVETFF